GSANTVMDYLTWLEDSYLLFFIKKFSWSVKSMAVNPRKVYTIDTGLARANSLSFSSDFGRLLENAVFIYLRAKGRPMYFFKEKGECDFIMFEKGKAIQAVQVCYRVEDTNFEREYGGLLEAMKFFNLTKGVIVTLDQKDKIEKEGCTIELVPAYEYVAEV